MGAAAVGLCEWKKSWGWCSSERGVTSIESMASKGIWKGYMGKKPCHDESNICIAVDLVRSLLDTGGFMNKGNGL